MDCCCCAFLFPFRQYSNVCCTNMLQICTFRFECDRFAATKKNVSNILLNWPYILIDIDANVKRILLMSVFMRTIYLYFIGSICLVLFCIQNNRHLMIAHLLCFYCFCSECAPQSNCCYFYLSMKWLIFLYIYFVIIFFYDITTDFMSAQNYIGTKNFIAYSSMKELQSMRFFFSLTLTFTCLFNIINNSGYYFRKIIKP